MRRWMENLVRRVVREELKRDRTRHELVITVVPPVPQPLKVDTPEYDYVEKSRESWRVRFNRWANRHLG